MSILLISDPADGAETWTYQKGGLNYATDLVKLIKEEYGDHFTVCVAGKMVYIYI